MTVLRFESDDRTQKRRELLSAALSAFLFVAQVDNHSAFNSYGVYLGHAATPGTCTSDRFPDFLNHTYRFRSATSFFWNEFSVTVTSGKYIKRADDGAPEWKMSLDEQHPIRLGRQPAVVLLFFASHIRATASGTEVLIVRCQREHLETVFEAGGEGIYPGVDKGYAYSDPNELRVTHAVWMPEDSHAGPSRQADELYRWDSGADRFRLVKKTERRVKP
jgi:hypothetical protein